MLTNKDFQRLSEVIHDEVESVVNRVVNQVIDTRNLVTRDEMLTHFDAVMGELKAIRENTEAMQYRQSEHSDQLGNHETRIQKLELHVLEKAS